MQMFLFRWVHGRCSDAVLGYVAGVRAVSQSEGQNLKYLSQQAWSTEEGLPQSSVHSIAQTPDGYLWLATEGGLVRFDGIAFRIFDRGESAGVHER